MSSSFTRVGTPVALVALMSLTPSCKKDAASGDAANEPADAVMGGKIALLLPESKTARYESHDRVHFERKLKQLCADCQIIYNNANQDASRQQSQAEAALTNGARVLVLDPVDSASASSIVARARQSRIPVISYDRLIANADVDYYISFDNEKIGRLQGQTLLDKLKADGKGDGTIVMIHGAPTDSNARLFKSGALSVIEGSGVQIGAQFDTPDWSPDKAQQQMEQAISQLGKDKIAGVYAANDGTAAGAISAMKAAGVTPLPPVTGQDAELAGVQRIISGDQYMTIYKSIKPEAETAAALAVALLRGGTPPAGMVNGKVNNGRKDVPSILLEPVAVTKDNLKSTIIADGFWKPEQLCVGTFKDACTAAQIQ